MNFKKINLLLAIFFAAIALPGISSAQSVVLLSDKTTHQVGDYFSLALVLDTSGKSINVISGTVNFSTDFLEVQSINTGDSFLTMWPTDPGLSKDNNITFMGGVPHGFSGSAGKVFTVLFKAKAAGKTFISFVNGAVFLNDGLGTQSKDTNSAPLKMTIIPAVNKVQPPPETTDKVKPLPFTPATGSNYSIENNKTFVTFSAVDKETGIAYYKVKEDYVLLPYWGTIFSSGWKDAKTPYILNVQHWWSIIHVRAYDNVGNFREEIILKPLDKLGFVILYALILVFMLAIVCLFLIILKK